jgi:deoxyribodipyrimidine photo-lyase
LLLITDEDCRVEDFDHSALDIRAVVALRSSHLRSSLPVSDAVHQFEAGALADAAERLGVAADMARADNPKALMDWAVASGATQIVTPYVTRGPLFDWLDTARPHLSAQGIALSEWQRAWDRAIWPHATAGFFKVKQAIPRILQDTGVT